MRRRSALGSSSNCWRSRCHHPPLPRSQSECAFRPESAIYQHVNALSIGRRCTMHKPRLLNNNRCVMYIHSIHHLSRSFHPTCSRRVSWSPFSYRLVPLTSPPRCQWVKSQPQSLHKNGTTHAGSAANECAAAAARDFEKNSLIKWVSGPWGALHASIRFASSQQRRSTPLGESCPQSQTSFCSHETSASSPDPLMRKVKYEVQVQKSGSEQQQTTTTTTWPTYCTPNKPLGLNLLLFATWWHEGPRS